MHACIFSNIGGCFFAVRSCKFFIFAVTACRKKSSNRVIFFCGKSCNFFVAVKACNKKIGTLCNFFCGHACDWLARLIAKKITRLNDFFVTRIYRKKKYSNYNIHPLWHLTGAPGGVGNRQWCGLTGWGEGDWRLASGHSSRGASLGWQPPMARAHWLRGQRVKPNRWSELTVRRWGMAARNSVGSQGGGMGSAAQPMVGAHTVPEGDGGPQWLGI